MKFKIGDAVKIKNGGGCGIVDNVVECPQMVSIPDTVFVGFNDGYLLDYADTELELDTSKMTLGVKEAIDWLEMHNVRRCSKLDIRFAQGYVQRMFDVCDITDDEREQLFRWLGIEV